MHNRKNSRTGLGALAAIALAAAVGCSSSEDAPGGEGEAGDAAGTASEVGKVVTTDSGLKYEVLASGDGASPGPTDRVEVHYRGTLDDGTEFDSSYKRGKPAEFQLDRVIKGWTEGLQLMNEGAKYEFYIPPELAYGDRGRLAHETLVFEVELLSVVEPAE